MGDRHEIREKLASLVAAVADAETSNKDRFEIVNEICYSLFKGRNVSAFFAAVDGNGNTKESMKEALGSITGGFTGSDCCISEAIVICLVESENPGLMASVGGALIIALKSLYPRRYKSVMTKLKGDDNNV